jgi:NADPH:quinone reductase-like Zn-dependent oxidoreductase
MKALVCRVLGDPTKPASEGGVLAVEDTAPAPSSSLSSVPSAGVRVKVAAAAVNFADMLMVQGQYQEKPNLPFVPGGEFSGLVTEVGVAVDPKHFWVGQRVAGMVGGEGERRSVFHTLNPRP